MHEGSVVFKSCGKLQQNMWSQMPEDSNTLSHWQENLKPHAFPVVL